MLAVARLFKKREDMPKPEHMLLVKRGDEVTFEVGHDLL
jgi:hypothetical protein